MSQLLSYLAAQARTQPGSTLRFVAGELWRRGRARLHPSLAGDLSELDSRRFRDLAGFFVPSVQIGRKSPSADPWIAATLARSGQASRGEFEIFREWAALGLQPDWHHDWHCGHRWPLVPAGRLRVLDASPGADVKRPWELARFHFGLDLTAASALTGSRHGISTFAALVSHWIEHNPWPLGIHWAMPMEVAIRSMNWIQAAMLASAVGQLDDSFAREISRSLFLHGRHLWAYREWNPVARANHYLACVVALLWLGMLFEATPEGRQWLEFGRRELLSEMESQTGPDGVVREGSSGYHALVTELFLSAALPLARREARDAGPSAGEPTNGRLASAIGRATSAAFAARLHRLFDFLSALCQGRHELADPPIWGDADDGRVLPFGGTIVPPVRVLSAVGDALAGRVYPSGCPALDAEVFWRFGLSPDHGAEHPLPRPHRSQAFPHAGFYFFSGSRIRGSVRCGPLGVGGWANHAHNDQLSFEFSLDGLPILVDPGLPCYSTDPSVRNLFRSTRYHNTVEVGGAEQNRFWPALLFRIVDDTRSQTHEWSAAAGVTAFAGSHSGYARLPQRAILRRELRLTPDDTLAVHDVVEVSGPAPLAWYFHFAPGLTPEPMPITPSSLAVPGMQPHSGWRLGPVHLAVWTAPPPHELAAETNMGWVAPHFGARVEAPILEFRGIFAGRTELKFIFSPAGAATLSPAGDRSQ
ncbi:MAG TPA: alginate lyase family protein [Candidatus Acidoferrales bacterium]|nr:alginate lyase family protein [Candidatus Acidoferrales bacterium]